MKLSKLALYLIVPTIATAVAGCGATITESIGGTVTGLSGGTQLVLVNNGSDPVTITANGSYTFSQKFTSGSSYNVTVQANPTGETCTPTNATGTISSTVGSVTNVNVNCVANQGNYNSVSGTVTGLESNATVILSDGSSLYTVTGNGAFSFPTQLLIGTSYNVTIATNATAGSCSVTSGGSGVVPLTGGTPVVITCK